MTIKSILLRNTTIEHVSHEPLFAKRPDLQLIFDLIPDEKSVLDLGCGDGALLEALVQEKKTKGRGIELDEKNVLTCVRRGLSVRQGNLQEGLKFIGVLEILYGVTCLHSRLKNMAGFDEISSGQLSQSQSGQKSGQD